MDNANAKMDTIMTIQKQIANSAYQDAEPVKMEVVVLLVILRMENYLVVIV